MRFPLAIEASAILLTSCASVSVSDTRAYGRVHDVSVADIHAAIDADRQHTAEKIYEIEVVSADEMRLYHEPRTDAKASYDVIRRVHGKWRFIVAPVIVG
jgi:hypothetical protein